MPALLEQFETAPCFAGLDELRAAEYGRLDATGSVYLDYTGGSLYAASQVEEHHRMLREGVYGNPHSVNPTSSAASALVDRARAAVLRSFDAPEDEYVCIFTPNATGALKLVGEGYPFGPRDRFLATFDNHNSVNGIREFARAKGPTCASPRTRCARSSTPSGTAPTTCSPTPRSPTSRGSSTRSSGSSSPTRTAGT